MTLLLVGNLRVFLWINPLPPELIREPRIQSADLYPEKITFKNLGVNSLPSY